MPSTVEPNTNHTKPSEAKALCVCVCLCVSVCVCVCDVDAMGVLPAVAYAFM